MTNFLNIVLFLDLNKCSPIFVFSILWFIERFESKNTYYQYCRREDNLCLYTRKFLDILITKLNN